ncbi:MAG: DUF945 family protein [Pseudomonadota bacterium]
MRKLILTLGVILIAVALLGPFATGKMAESAVMDNQAETQASLPPWLELVEPAFERGWFSSRASARVIITDPQVRDRVRGFLGADQFGDQPAVILDSVVTHGPLIGLLTPGFAEVRTQFLTEGDAETTLPVRLKTLVGLGGTVTMDWMLDNGSYDADTTKLLWQDVTARHVVRPNSSDIDLGIAASQFAIDREVDPVSVNELNIDWNSNRIDGRVFSEVRTTGSLIADEQEPINLGLTLGIGNLNPNAVAPVMRILQLMANNPEMPAPVKLKVIESDLKTLFSDEFSLVIDQNMSADEAPGSVMQTRAEVNFAAVEAMPEPFDVNRLVERATRGGQSTASMVVNQTMFEALQARDPLTQQWFLQLQGLGALIPEENGDGYVMQMDYADALITLNGIPIPLPPEAR